MVTVVIPVYNEREFIVPCLESLLCQDVGSDNIEILVVDGGSNDGTPDIVQSVIKNHPQVKLLANSEKYSVHAFNVGILGASKRSKYITFLNCHAEYSNDRLSKSIRYLTEYGADAVGGCSNAVSRLDTLFGHTVANVLRSRFATGSIFRTELAKPQFADTASGCLYKLEMFDQIGLFNKKLIYSQDIELNRRVCLSGRKILYVPDIVTIYKARADFRSFVKHSYRNGLWVIIPFMYSKIIPVSLRHLVPIISVAVTGVALVLATLNIVPLSLVFCFILLYVAGSVISSALIAIKNRNVEMFFMAFAVFPLFHGIYAFGSVFGCIQVCWAKIMFR